MHLSFCKRQRQRRVASTTCTPAATRSPGKNFQNVQTVLKSTSVGAWLEARAELAGEEGRRQEERKGEERGGEEAKRATMNRRGGDEMSS